MASDTGRKLIEVDAFPFEFVSRLAERESWRKEIHRPIYHVHKWWAKRLGSVFRGALLGSVLPEQADLEREFYRPRASVPVSVFDPFMGSGTTVGEAHKLGFIALGQDINPVAAESVRIALGEMSRQNLQRAFDELTETIGAELRGFYASTDSHGRACDVLYYFWVMQTPCIACSQPVPLFSSYTFARNAYPHRKPQTKIVCPACGAIGDGLHGARNAACGSCGLEFDPESAPARGQHATCQCCQTTFSIIASIAASKRRPTYRLYAKLVLTQDGNKEYLAATEEDANLYSQCSRQLGEHSSRSSIRLPSLRLEAGRNTSQAMSYGFREWRDFFNDRQLLALGLLQSAIARISDGPSRDALLTLFSGALEFNNMFASYKGEGTGAVRHMFSHHILKPERTPIEANLWGTPKSSGSFSTLYKSRLLRALQYRDMPTEIEGASGDARRQCSRAFSGKVSKGLPTTPVLELGKIYLGCGDSSLTELPSESIDLVVTDPPFFDNVHYSELADFFYAWQQLVPRGFIGSVGTTRSALEVQDTAAADFTDKLQAVLAEMHRVLKPDALLVFSYHHSRNDGWIAVARAIIAAGFVVVNSQPVKAEMSVAAPKSQAKEPIQLDILLVCRKNPGDGRPPSRTDARESASRKIARLEEAGFRLSANDRRVVLFGQLLTTIRTLADADSITGVLNLAVEMPERRLSDSIGGTETRSDAMMLFGPDT